MNSPRPKPAHELRFGTIKAAIWRNESENGPRFNTTFSRGYRDGEQWHNTDSFGREDLLVVAKLADLAHSWIHSQQREAPTEAASPAPAPGNSRTETARPAASTAPGFSRPRPSRDPV